MKKVNIKPAAAAVNHRITNSMRPVMNSQHDGPMVAVEMNKLKKGNKTLKVYLPHDWGGKNETNMKGEVKHQHHKTLRSVSGLGYPCRTPETPHSTEMHVAERSVAGDSNMTHMPTGEMSGMGLTE